MSHSCVAAFAGRLRRLLPLAAALALLLAACVPLPGTPQSGTAIPTGESPASGAVETPSPAAAAAQAALAEKLGLPASQIAIVSVEAVEWPDACLGAAGEGEMCAQVITPGYRVVLEANGKQYEVHTDESGKNVRVVNS
jgi:hypothetical protein